MSLQVLPEGEEKVYVDDRTGNTYVVTDDGEADASSGGRIGRLSRRLSDNQQWLDGLSNQEYDEYMVSTLGMFPCCSSCLLWDGPCRRSRSCLCCDMGDLLTNMHYRAQDNYYEQLDREDAAHEERESTDRAHV